MNTNKLLMFTAASLLIPTAQAVAEIKTPTTVMVIPHPVTDKAPVSGPAGKERLRRSDERQPGNEMSTFAFFADGKTGFYFAMTTELNGQRPPLVNGKQTRMQLSLTPIQLAQGQNGAVTVTVDQAKAKFVTSNDGNEYRNANAPIAFAIDGGNAVCAKYNYQPNNTNDTKNYLQCFDINGNVVMPQTEVAAKNNDDLCISTEGSRPVKAFGNETDAAGATYVFSCGGNGNGRDDSWIFVGNIKKNGANYTYSKKYDTSFLAKEERSRTMIAVGTDRTLAAVAGTEGNNQPPRDGCHLAGFDIDPTKYNGPNQQGAILWKQQIAGRKQLGNIRTYCQRAMIVPISTLDGQGKMAPTNRLFWRHGDLNGNNRNNEKGGEYLGAQLGVIAYDRTGYQFVTPLTNVATTELAGFDGTHNMINFTFVGNGTNLKPALLMQTGSHTGGNSTAQVRAIGWDEAADKFTNLQEFAGGWADRHLYPNYLGGNPGNQGKNHQFADVVPDPFTPGNWLAIYATTGKGENMDPATKLAAYITVAQIAGGGQSTGGGQNNGGQNNGGQNNGGGGDDGSDGSDTTLGGCSAGGSAGGLATFLLIGLAAFIRRRR